VFAAIAVYARACTRRLRHWRRARRFVVGHDSLLAHTRARGGRGIGVAHGDVVACHDLVVDYTTPSFAARTILQCVLMRKAPKGWWAGYGYHDARFGTKTRTHDLACARRCTRWRFAIARARGGARAAAIRHCAPRGGAYRGDCHVACRAAVAAVGRPLHGAPRNDSWTTTPASSTARKLTMRSYTHLFKGVVGGPWMFFGARMPAFSQHKARTAPDYHASSQHNARPAPAFHSTARARSRT